MHRSHGSHASRARDNTPTMPWWQMVASDGAKFYRAMARWIGDQLIHSIGLMENLQEPHGFYHQI
jgi:hypothetical protein